MTINWSSISGLDGDLDSKGYYVTKGCDSHHLRLTNKYSPGYSRGFEHLYNTFEISIEIFPKVDVLNLTCDDDYYSYKLHRLLGIIMLYCAFNYKFTFNYFQFVHLLDKYNMHFSHRHSKIPSHFYNNKNLATGYDIISDKTGDKICTLDGVIGYHVYTYLEDKVIIPSNIIQRIVRATLSHITLANGLKYKTVRVKHRIPKPLVHVCQLWSNDMRAMILCNHPQIVL